VALARPDGSFIDRLTYGAQEADLSAAREPDGSTNWVTEWSISPGAANPAGPAGQPPAPLATGDSTEMVPAASDVSDQVLGYDLIPEFDLQISDDGMASLRANPDTWVQATIVYQGRSYGPVGVNLKGTASFQTIDQKPAFRVGVDQFAKGAQFFGLKKFMLNNMTTDPSMIHERLAYWIARQVGGVPASRCNHSWVTLNGAPLGLYATVEEPRDQMMAYFFKDATGGVYIQGRDGRGLHHQLRRLHQRVRLQLPVRRRKAGHDADQRHDHRPGHDPGRRGHRRGRQGREHARVRSILGSLRADRALGRLALRRDQRARRRQRRDLH
jgi:hypothetical protein